MNKSRSVIVLLTLFISITATANIIKNSDFDNKLDYEYRRSGHLKNHKFSIFTEDLTWNKCGKIEILQYGETDKGSKSYGSGVIIGGDKDKAGFPVIPGETYKFTLELKGTVKHAHISALYWTGECRYYKDRHRLKASISGINIQKEWNKYNGTFKIPKDAKRAALYVTIWGDEDQRHLPDKPGDYLLIDKIEVAKTTTGLNLLSKDSSPETRIIDEKKAVKLQLNAREPVVDGQLDDKQWENAAKISGFYFYKDQTPAKYQTEAKLLAGKDAIYIGVTCHEPEIDKLKASYKENGGKKIWRDDEIEVFFDSISEGRVLNQFVVGAGGGRWMGWGAQAIQPENESYKKWTAKTGKNDNAWTAEIKIPYKIIGWEKAPEHGTTIAFNICRQRMAGKKEWSCWNAVRGNFHEKDRYGILALGTLNKHIEKQIKELQKQLSEIKKESPEKEQITKSLNRLTKLIQKEITPEEWQDARKKLIMAKDAIFFLKLSGLTFAATAVSPSTTDFSLPLIPENIDVTDKKIVSKAAINEFKSQPILITNLTNKTQDYRVLLCSGLENGIEVIGLKGANKTFPIENLKIRQGVRVKDSDGKIHRQRFDPLPLMNQAYTITVPPKDSGLVWITFDCRNVKSDLYKGFLRVIPLDETATFKLTKKGWTYEGSMRDIPFELNVLPIELPKTPVIPLWIMRLAANEKFFKDMIEHDNRIFQLSPYSFKVDFDEKGNVTSKFGERIHNIVKNHLKWAKKYGVEIQFLVGFSAYNVFQKHLLKDKFKYGTEEWKNAWKNWNKEVDSFFKKHGVTNKNYYVEVWDEPHIPDAEKVIETCRLAKEACPEMLLQITFGASRHTHEKMNKMLPFVDIWCMWGSYYNDTDFTPFLEILKENKKKIWMYYCNTNIRASLYRYYRLHAWKGLYYENPKLGLFTYLNGPGGYYGRASWKTCVTGAVIYNSCNEPITSIRYECLREGFDDLKYIKKLETVKNLCKEKGVAPDLITEAENFLKNAPYDVVIKNKHNPKTAPEIRVKAANLIMKLQQALTAK